MPQTNDGQMEDEDIDIEIPSEKGEVEVIYVADPEKQKMTLKNFPRSSDKFHYLRT